MNVHVVQIHPILYPNPLNFTNGKEKKLLVSEDPLISTPKLKHPPIDTLQAYSNVSFLGYSCELKRLFKKGRIKVRYSFYGGKLNPKKATIEHIIPKSKGGISKQSNFVLCNGEQNWLRGNDPIESYLNWEHVGIYLDQFRGVRIGTFNGDEYIKQVLNSINEALRTGR